MAPFGVMKRVASGFKGAFTLVIAFAVIVIGTSGMGALAGASSGLVAFERLTCTYDEQQTETCVLDIWVVRGGGGGERLLTRKPAAGGYSPAWSPDGRMIAFIRETDKELWVMNPERSGQRRLIRLSGRLDSSEAPRDPAWSPDGRMIAFGTVRYLYVVSAHGGPPRRLTRMPAGADSPTWSPDGRRIAFHTPAFGRNAIYVINADGTSRRRLTPNGLFASGPVWAPVGRKILFFTREGDELFSVISLGVINADGTGRRQLAEDATGAAWSPDGRAIAVTTGHNSVGDTLYVMSTEGRNRTRTSPIGTLADHPTWSPDGQRIAFKGHLGEGREGGLYVVDADGTDLRKITRIDCTPELPPSTSHSCHHPVWQPAP